MAFRPYMKVFEGSRSRCAIPQPVICPSRLSHPEAIPGEKSGSGKCGPNACRTFLGLHRMPLLDSLRIATLPGVDRIGQQQRVYEDPYCCPSAKHPQ